MKKLSWYVVALMAFTGVWGFDNAINGFASFNGVKAAAFWLLVVLLYFVPYVLMVGELGSTFQKENGGVSSWINKLLGSRMAFFAGWMYFVVHLPYISQRVSKLLVSISWIIYGRSAISEINIVVAQLVTLSIFLLAVYLSKKGISFLGKLSSIAGMSLFVLCILFIILMIFAPAIAAPGTINELTASDFRPDFSLGSLTNLSILLFAVGGCEKISPYVNKVDNPSKNFPKAMISLAIMIGVCAIFNTIAVGMMVDSNNIPSDLMTNGAYYAFQRLGEYYNLGNLFVILYAISYFICGFSVTIISIDAPLRMFLNSCDSKYIPNWLGKKDKDGNYVNGLKIVCLVVSFFILLPIFGVNNINELVNWLIKLNSICMPLRYLWVFIAYIFLKIKEDDFINEGFIFMKNRKIGIIIGAWCFILTFISCVMGMKSTDPFELALNIIAPLLLVGSGFLLPLIKRHS